MNFTDMRDESENPVLILIISSYLSHLSCFQTCRGLVVMENYKLPVTEKVQIFLFFWFWRDREWGVKVPHVMIAWVLHWFSDQDRFPQHSTFQSTTSSPSQSVCCFRWNLKFSTKKHVLPREELDDVNVKKGLAGQNIQIEMNNSC